MKSKSKNAIKNAVSAKITQLIQTRNELLASNPVTSWELEDVTPHIQRSKRLRLATNALWEFRKTL